MGKVIANDICLRLSILSFPLPTIRKDRIASLGLSRCNCSLAQYVHALLIFPLFICQNIVSHCTSSGFLDQNSGRSKFYLDHCKRVIPCFFPPWHNGKFSLTANQRKALLSVQLVLEVLFLCSSGSALSSAPHMYKHSCAQTPRWIHHFPVHYFPACSGFVLQFSAKGSGHLWGSIVPVCKPLPHPLSKPLHVPPAQPVRRQLQQGPNRWSLLPAGKRACILPSCCWRNRRYLQS